MNDVMRARLLRKLDALPEDKLYQVLDYIDFLESRHSPDGPSRPRGFQRWAERLEDGMRTRRVSPRTIGRAMTVVGTAGRMARTVAAAGRQAVRTSRAILDEVESTAAPRDADERPETAGRGHPTGHDRDAGGARRAGSDESDAEAVNARVPGRNGSPKDAASSE